MDDELFDVTQNDLLGALFSNMSTIRIIKAPNKPNIRDSLPPTSALRFNPTSILGQKRDGSPLNRNAEPFWNPQKRQRTLIDPDHPIPSREIDSLAGGLNGGLTGGRLEDIPEKPETIIPDSQQSAILGHEDEDNNIVPNVRGISPMIKESPPPSSPSPVKRSIPYHTHAITDYVTKFAARNANAQSKKAPNSLVSPFQERPPRIQGTPRNVSGVKCASHQIQRATTHRERSISTTATSPMANEPQLPPLSHSKSAKRQGPSETPGAKLNTPKNRSPRDEASIYDDFGSDTEEPKLSQSKLTFKKGPQSGLSSTQKSAKSPYNNSRDASKVNGSVPNSKELPLTPKSKAREENEERQKRENEEAAKEARTAAAKAAEERRRESEREAVAAKAEWIRKEKLEERKAEEKQKQAVRKQKELATAEAQRLKDEKEKLRKTIEEDDRLDILMAEEAAKKRVEDAAKKAAEESKKLEALEPSKRVSETPQGSRKGTPVTKPSVILPRQSSTPHYPRGKKSSLKTSRSSESVASSSPAAPKDTSLEAQVPLPSKCPRRVSFDLNEATTPAKPQAMKKTLVDTPKQNTTPKIFSSQAPTQSQTPIPLPKTFRRPDRSATPVRQQSVKPSAMNQPPLVATRAGSNSRSAAPKPIPPPLIKSLSTESKALPKKDITPESRKTVASTPDRSVPVKSM